MKYVSIEQEDIFTGFHALLTRRLLKESQPIYQKNKIYFFFFFSYIFFCFLYFIVMKNKCRENGCCHRSYRYMWFYTFFIYHYYEEHGKCQYPILDESTVLFRLRSQSISDQLHLSYKFVISNSIDTEVTRSSFW